MKMESIRECLRATIGGGGGRIRGLPPLSAICQKLGKELEWLKYDYICFLYIYI